MKVFTYLLSISLLILSSNTFAINNYPNEEANSIGSQYRLYKLDSRIKGLKLALHHYPADSNTTTESILLLHGSSFPSKLSFGFKISDMSWIDHLTAKGFQVYALDFLGYGDSDRYPEMTLEIKNAKPLGRAMDVLSDVNLAVEFIKNSHQLNTVNLLGHSWGGAVAAKFAETYPDKINKLVLYAAITESLVTQSKNSAIVPAYSQLTPEERINSLVNLAPKGGQPLMEKEVVKNWGIKWLKSDPLVNDSQLIKFPAGPKADVREFLSGNSFYDPTKIKANVLIVRGEYDRFPSDKQALKLFENLSHAKSRKYKVIQEGTHVLHLEKNRTQLYQVVNNFLQDKTE